MIPSSIEVLDESRSGDVRREFRIPRILAALVDFVETIPRNPSGKILKRELSEPCWQGRERRVN